MILAASSSAFISRPRTCLTTEPVGGGREISSLTSHDCVTLVFLLKRQIRRQPSGPLHFTGKGAPEEIAASGILPSLAQTLSKKSLLMSQVALVVAELAREGEGITDSLRGVASTQDYS